MTVRLREHWQRTGWPLTMTVTLPLTFQPTLFVLNRLGSAAWGCSAIVMGRDLAAAVNSERVMGNSCGAALPAKCGFFAAVAIFPRRWKSQVSAKFEPDPPG